MFNYNNHKKKRPLKVLLKLPYALYYQKDKLKLLKRYKTFGEAFKLLQVITKKAKKKKFEGIYFLEENRFGRKKRYSAY